MKNLQPHSSEHVMYILVNNDVKMGKGKIASQVCHSACHATRILERQRSKEPGYNMWIKEGEPKIVLKSTEKEMLDIIDTYEVDKKIKRTDPNSIWCTFTRDFGRTQIAPDTLTTVAFKPVDKNLAPKELSKMKLL